VIHALSKLAHDLCSSWLHGLYLSGSLVAIHLAGRFARNYFETAALNEISTLEKEVSMNIEKDVKIGDVGDVDFKVQPDGKIAIVATISKDFEASDTHVSASVKVIQGEKLLMDKLVAALPAGFLRDAAQKAEELAIAAQRPAAPIV
jgi:hypothetical protein